MTRGVAECNGRTAEDLRLHAEKAAFEGQTLRTFFNSLQARTIHKLSPETRLFAEISYEKKLVHYVSIALIECASSEEGKEKAKEIASSDELKNLRLTWKPLFDCCSQLLRGHKLEATNARLSRLSDHWSKSKEGDAQIRRMKEVAQHVLYNSVDRAKSVCSEIMDWIDLYSIHDVPMKETLRSAKDSPIGDGKISMVVVDKSETFSEAESFLLREVETDAKIHVIMGNEDDGVRFYKRICHRFSSWGVQLNWKEREYGRISSPKIVIGSRDHFALQYTGTRSRTLTSAVMIHAESKLEDSFNHRFELGNLDDYLAKLFVVTTITMNHFDEIKEVTVHRSDTLLKMMRSWPAENQVLNEMTVVDLWNKSFKTYGTPLNRVYFLQDLRSYSQDAIAEKIKEFKVPSHLQRHVERHSSTFVQTSIAARNAEFGQDYVLYSERSSGKLELKIRVKKQTTDGSFGLQQFLELRHGCAMTSYRVSNVVVTASALIESFDRVLIVQRSNPFRQRPKDLNVSLTTWRKETRKPNNYASSILEFPFTIATDAKIYTNSLLIVVCSTNQLLDETFKFLKGMSGINVSICETPLGVLNESSKNPLETLVVCTSSACFEGWSFVPRTRDKLTMYVYHHRLDTVALEIACDHAKPLEVQSFTCDLDILKQLNVSRVTESNWWLSISSRLAGRSRYYEPEELIERYRKIDDINDLIEAKKLIHKKMKQITTTAKIVTSRLPDLTWDSTDSPLDIACKGFIESSRGRINEMRMMREEVERMLTNHGMNKGINKMRTDEDELRRIAKRNMISYLELSSFVRFLRSCKKPITWFEARRQICGKFELELDAEIHWEKCYEKSRKDNFALALSPECVSNATKYLQNLRLVPFPENYRQLMIQCSDRHLEECTLYYPETQFNDELLNMKGVSIEYYANADTANDFRSLSEGTALLDTVVKESSERGCPLYLFPRRCYSRLTRDLFDSGNLICDYYRDIDDNMHPYDTIELPIITETSSRSFLEKLLKSESALMEYGTIEWMEWMAKRLRFFDYNQEVINFYHRSVAERDYCEQDEALLQRIRSSLFEPSLGKATTSIEKLKVDAFVYNSMDILNRGERLVLLNPSSSSIEALQQLSHFIRARRMPPS